MHRNSPRQDTHLLVPHSALYYIRNVTQMAQVHTKSKESRDLNIFHTFVTGRLDEEKLVHDTFFCLKHPQN